MTMFNEYKVAFEGYVFIDSKANVAIGQSLPFMFRPKADDGQDLSATDRQAGQKSRPLYDIPYMFEAREFLRKKLIGKKVC